MRVVSGLTFMYKHSYRMAAIKFFLVEKHLTNQFNAVLIAEDIAM